MPKGGELKITARREDELIGFYEPFFTTKAKGQDLGLAAFKRLVEAQGGARTGGSCRGAGCTFTVKLPAPAGL